MLEHYNNLRVLVTGGTGFIGVHLISALLANGAQVSSISRNPVRSNNNVTHYSGDLKDSSFVDLCMQTVMPDIIFHLAASKARSHALEEFEEAIDSNLIGTLNLLRSTVGATQLRALVVVGTAEEYGNSPIPFMESKRECPVSAYSFSKSCVTHLCQTFQRILGTPVVIIRPTIAYGPGQGMDMFLPALISSLISGEKFPMTEGSQTRDFIYISDLIDAFLRAAVIASPAGQIYNIGSGQGIRIADMAIKLERIFGNPGLVQFGKRPYRPLDVMEYAVDCRRAREELQWEPQVFFEEGLKKTIEYYREKQE